MYVNKKTKVLAALPDNATRETEEKSHEIRSEFQRDRDRILYSRAFRRLNGKTQVFLSVKDDHVRNRLTHTLEVNQIAQTISKALGLNMELTEAIALGHDLGHTPFGHVGERTLNHIMNGCYKIADFNINIHEKGKGFKHNFQGVRVARELEENQLNLTNEVLWGILNHSKLRYSGCKKDEYVECSLKHSAFKSGIDCNNEPKYEYNLSFYDKIIEDIDAAKYWTIEALVVGIADEIAQRHHDIEDAIEFNILAIDNLIDEIDNRFKYVFRSQDKDLVKQIRNASENKYQAIGLFSKLIVNFLTTNLIEHTEKNLEKFIKDNEISENNTFYNIKEAKYSEKVIKNLVCFSSDVEKIDEGLQKFLRNRILNSFEAQRMDGSGQYVIRKLFEAYIHNPQQLPDKTIKTLYKTLYNNIKENEEVKHENKYIVDNKIEKILDYKNYKENKNNVGKIREMISRLHYQVDSSIESKYNLYNDTLLRVICDYIAGMTDKYALEQHKSLYNCGNFIF